MLSLLSFFSGPLTKESPLWEEILEKEQQVKTIPTMHDYLKATTKSQGLIKGYYDVFFQLIIAHFILVHNRFDN